ncbi:beta-lactamase [Aquipluma nitroreducens]|uniref:Beta-lactamase n=1 Tax=Aquipluma nitroreducens TaxID=2010828 RepID=A0A5K7SF09_9BACT|nr:GDSL-type esterase/lipase family protein [Aquipluma nitroreducens]BBE20181.1 beta-lactamase [Aquipluma nitroreducens]
MKILIFFFLMSAVLIVNGQNSKFSTYYEQRKSLFEVLPDTKGEIIFLGNSITDGGEWAELFGNKNVKNRGISGDTTDGVLFRLGEVTKSKPKIVFLLIGINDLSRGIPKDSVLSNICSIALKIKKDSPETKVFVQSILPVNPIYGLFKTHTNKTDEVMWINAQLKNWCEKEHFQFIDLFSHFKCIDSNLLNPELTNDGLHLKGEGYLLWMKIIKLYLKK